jgi:Tfp pilus assembly protein PilO
MNMSNARAFGEGFREGIDSVFNSLARIWDVTKSILIVLGIIIIVLLVLAFFGYLVQKKEERDAKKNEQRKLEKE